MKDSLIRMNLRNGIRKTNALWCRDNTIVFWVIADPFQEEKLRG